MKKCLEKRMKVFGIVIGILGILVTLIFSINLFSISNSLLHDSYSTLSISNMYSNYGFIVLLLGSLMSLTSAISLYGQGVQLENMKAMEKKYLTGSVIYRGSTTPSMKSDNKMFCSSCGQKIIDSVDYCPYCGNKV